MNSIEPPSTQMNQHQSKIDRKVTRNRAKIDRNRPTPTAKYHENNTRKYLSKKKKPTGIDRNRPESPGIDRKMTGKLTDQQKRAKRAQSKPAKRR